MLIKKAPLKIKSASKIAITIMDDLFYLAPVISFLFLHFSPFFFQAAPRRG